MDIGTELKQTDIPELSQQPRELPPSQQIQYDAENN